MTPSLVRLQAEQQMAKARQAKTVKNQESQISKYYKALPPFPNTIIPHRYIERYPREIYQVHHQGISDFLMMMMMMALMTTMKKKIVEADVLRNPGQQHELDYCDDDDDNDDDEELESLEVSLLLTIRTWCI